MLPPIERRIAQELGVQERQVTATVELLDGGSTVPFIARYRKEATGGLDDIQLRALETRLTYLRELEKRREAILGLVAEQGKLTPALEHSLRLAEDKARLEDLYLPYKVKRRTKAAIAREAGLEPLADGLLADPTQNPETVAAAYVDADKGVADVKAALDGARQILMERWAEDPDIAAELRAYVWTNAKLKSQLVEGKAEAGAKFRDYFDAAEALGKIPSHRALALFRGRKEEILSLSLDLGEPEERGRLNPCEAKIALRVGVQDLGRPADRWLLDSARWTWRIKLSLRVETDLLGRLWDAAEAEAIHVFAENLRALLLAAPAGSRATIGLDPGFRTGVKVAVIDNSGKLAETATIYPHEPQRRWDEALAVLDALVRRFDVTLIAIGNGTASRETDKLVSDLLKQRPELASKLRKAMVSEAGASVYSASEFASQEMPGIDVSLRGAASIARRLQDPLAELVKIDPKSIGVGQYQHDVSEIQLGKTLDAVVEDCVNGVGVDLNTASAPLLARVSGLGDSLARAVVAFREAHGRFKNRKQLLEVARLGPKAFEQCAGFLRIREGDHPLDASAVHPEAYPVVERILDKLGRPLASVMGDVKTLRGLKAQDFADARFGAPTVQDILAELEKPGRDPRPEFRWAEYKEGIEKISDLKPGMVLEGVVTNVANFGAFVDIGVHQDGLVHVSALAERFVKDPREVVKPGDLVSVKVLEVDAPRKRISLTMRMADQPGKAADGPRGGGRDAPLTQQQKKAAAPKPEPASGGALAEAFARAKKR